MSLLAQRRESLKKKRVGRGEREKENLQYFVLKDGKEIVCKFGNAMNPRQNPNWLPRGQHHWASKIRMGRLKLIQVTMSEAGPAQFKL